MTFKLFQKLEKRPLNLLPGFIFFNLLLTGVAILLLIFQGVVLLSLSTKPPPALVQMVDGRSILSEAVEWDYRTDETIYSFIQEILPLLKWESNKLPKEFLEAGENKTVRVPFLIGINVPRVNYAASFALSDGFMKAYLKGLSSLRSKYRKEGIKEVVSQISGLSRPQIVKENPRQWTVDVAANLKFFGDGNELLDINSDNSRVHLKAVRQPKFVMEPTPAQRLVNGIRAAGLEITLIEPLKE